MTALTISGFVALIIAAWIFGCRFGFRHGCASRLKTPAAADLIVSLLSRNLAIRNRLADVEDTAKALRVMFDEAQTELRKYAGR